MRLVTVIEELLFEPPQLGASLDLLVAGVGLLGRSDRHLPVRGDDGAKLVDTGGDPGMLLHWRPAFMPDVPHRACRRIFDTRDVG